MTLDVPKDLRPLSTDRQKVKQILLNLLSNALKFTHEGGVTIGARRDSGRTHRDAVGRRHRHWHRRRSTRRSSKTFRQLDNSPTRAYGGTGLELSICSRLAQMLGGRIAVRSQVGKGSTFTLTLPAQGRK